MDDERLWQQVGDDEVIYDGWLKIHRRTYRLPDGRTVEWDMHAGGPTVAVLALTSRPPSRTPRPTTGTS